MFSKKNHVGRPSNLEIKNNKIKKNLIYAMPVVVVLMGIILISSGSLNNLMGNSVMIEDSFFDYQITEEVQDKCYQGSKVIVCPYKLNLKTSLTNSGLRLYWDDLRKKLSNKNDSVYYKITGENSDYLVNNEILDNRPMMEQMPTILKNVTEYSIGGDHWLEMSVEYNITITAYIPQNVDDDNPKNVIACTSIKFKLSPKSKIELQTNSYEGGVKLSWNKISQAAYYIVTNDKNSLNINTKNNYYNDTKIKAGEGIEYSVAAYNSNNKLIATATNREFVHTTAEEPKIVKSSRTPLGFELEMQGGYNTSRYAVYLDDVGNYKKIGESTGKIFRWNSAKNGETYRFVVKSLDSNGKETSVFSKSYFAGVFYSAPIIDSINEIGGGVALSWNKIKGVSKYAIYIKGGIYKEYEKLKESKSNGASVLLVLPIGTYTFKVVGLSENGAEITSYVGKQYVVKAKVQTTISATKNYSCPSGYTKSGSGTSTKCIKKETKAASKKIDSYSCAPIVGITLSGTKCIHKLNPIVSYSCPSGYTKIGDGPTASCEKIEYPVNKTRKYCSGGSYWLMKNGKCEYQKQANSSCPSGYSKSGGNCVKTYKATVKNRRYSCPSGGKLNNSGQCVITKSPSYTCPKFQDVRGTIKNRTCYYVKNTTTGTTQTCNRGYLYAARCIVTTSLQTTKSCAKGYTRSGNYCTKITNAAIHYQYYCASGYTKTGSGENTKCSKTLTKTVTVTYTCPSGYTKTGSGTNTKCKK